MSVSVTKQKKKHEWKPWIARIAFGASILALLGTSQPRWYMAATITGANDGGAPPSPDNKNGKRALLVNVESSREAQLSYTNRFGARIDPPWGRGDSPSSSSSSSSNKDQAIKTAFLLPPNAALHSLMISGHCNGGCCSNEKCTPPQGSYIRATIDHVNIWTKSTRREQRITVASGPKKEGEKTLRIPHVVFEIEAGRLVEVVISSGDNDGKAKPLQLPSCYDPNANAVAARVAPSKGGDAATEASSLTTDVDASSGTSEAPPRQRCSYSPYSKPIEDPIDASFVVEATIWGACPDPSSPCEAPSDPREPRIFDLRATTDY